MSEKMRDDFHEWCRSIGFTLKMNAWGNDYAMGYGWEQWQAWQASRAAMVAELPANCKGMALTVDELIAMLGEIGVTLK